MQHTSFINYRANAVEAGCTEGPRIIIDPQRMKYSVSGNEEELSAHLSLLLMGPGVQLTLGAQHSANLALRIQFLSAPCPLSSTEPE